MYRILVATDGSEHSRRAVDYAARRQRRAVTGKPAATILGQAAKLGVDEIIIGSRGLGRLGAALLGSVAYKIVHDAKVAVSSCVDRRTATTVTR